MAKYTIVQKAPKEYVMEKPLFTRDVSRNANYKETSKPTILGTIKNTATQIGKGTLRTGEKAFDTFLQFANSKANPFNPYRGEQLKANQQTVANIVRDDSTQELLDKLGYSTVRKSGKTYQQELDEKSALKSYGLGGQVTEAIGGQLPNILLGNLATGTAAKTIASILPTTISAFGGGAEEAYRGRATFQQATGAGALNAAVETATEFITGGVPGVKTGFLAGFDKLASKGIGKVSSALTRSLLDAGYKIVGEGFEEALAEVLSPVIKNATYSKGEKVNWENVINSAVQGMIVGGLLNAPSSISDVSSGIKTDQIASQEQKAFNTIKDAQIKTNQPTNTNTQPMVETPQQGAVIEPQGNINIKIDEPTSRGYFDGQQNMTITAKIGNKVVGKVDYNEYDGKPSVEMIEVNPDYRRKGIGTKLLQKLQNTYPDTEIDMGMSTPDGTNLINSIGTKEVESEYANDFKKLNDINNKINYYENLSSAEMQNLTENQNDEWNDLYIKQTKLQDILREKKPTKTLISTQQPTITPTTQETKQRGVFSTALQNQNIPSEIKSGIKGTNQDYIVITDNDALQNAQQRITDYGYDKSLTTLETKFANNEKLSKYDIAEATLLYNDAFARGDTKKALDILSSIAVAGTESGQVSQATSILQRATPDGRLLALQKQVNKINDKFKDKKNFKPVELDAEDVNNIKNAQNKNDLDTAVNNAIVKVSKQMPNTLTNRLNEWRYLAMLGNPKTHIRNIVSNLAMKGTSKVKNTLSAFIEDVVKPEERTRTLEKASQKTKDFVNKDVLEQKSRILGTDKYDQNRLGIKPTQMKASQLNSALLEFMDWKSSKGAYKDALSNYLTANKIDVDNMTPQQIESAREYAVDQAQEQTFRQFSKLAEMISSAGNKNKLVKLATDAILPFKTTPINIAKTGIEYSPIGLVKTLTKNALDLKNGNIKPAKFIDNISKGLTGSAITALGYILAEAGVLTASGSDEDKENYFQQMAGKQPYSIRIGGKTITLDWLSPSAMPFFMGAELSEMKQNGLEPSKLVNIADGLSTIIDPLTEMSMLQGINSTLKSYDESALGGVVINALQNYALQYIPTVSGQIARTLTPDRKSTTGSGTGIEKKFNTFTNKVKAKLPIIANTLEPYVDQFGNTQTTNSIAQRAFENFLSPAYIKDVKTEKVYEEIQKLYDKTGEASILPTSSARYFTVKGEKVNLTPEEYTKFSTIDGQYAFEKLNGLFNSNSYKTMTDENKVKAIESFYKAGQKVAKAKYNK